MDCSQVQELLSDYVEDTLQPSARKQVSKHLSTCKDCSAELRELRNYLQAMSSLGAINAPADFLEKVHKRIEQGSVWRKLYEKIFVPLRIKVPLELAGVAIAALLVVFLHQEMSPEKKAPMEPRLSQAPHSPASGQTERREQQSISDELEVPIPAAPVPPARAKATITLSLSVKRELQSYGEKSTINESTTAGVPGPEVRDSQSNVAAMRPQQPEPLRERATGAASPQQKSGPMDVGRLGAAMDDKDATAYMPDLIESILRYAQRAGGKVSCVENQSEADELDLVIVEIPTSSYVSFLNDLRQMGEVNLLEGSATMKDSDVIQLRIDLVYPRQSR